jgi:hypothetical protein
VEILVDNFRGVCFSSNSRKKNNLVRRIDVRHHYIREKVVNGEVVPQIHSGERECCRSDDEAAWYLRTCLECSDVATALYGVGGVLAMQCSIHPALAFLVGVTRTFSRITAPWLIPLSGIVYSFSVFGYVHSIV